MKFHRQVPTFHMTQATNYNPKTHRNEHVKYHKQTRSVEMLGQGTNFTVPLNITLPTNALIVCHLF
jgi:hypothetical protein